MVEYQDILSQIFTDDFIIEDENEDSISDEVMAKNANKERTIDDAQYKLRNEYYSDLLSEYIDVYNSKTSWNKWYKFFFFLITMLIFIAIITCSIIAVIIVASKDNSNNTDIAVVFSCLAGVVSSIIILPRIIAKHLFPTNEDENMIGMVKNMQKNDALIRSFYQSNVQKSQKQKSKK